MNKDLLKIKPTDLSSSEWQLSVGAQVRGQYGTKNGNDLIRSMAEFNGKCKLPSYGDED